MVHNLDPFLWEITSGFGIRWYGLAYLAAFVLAYFVFQWLGPKQKMGLTPNLAGDFVFYCALGTLIGGRLGYCLFYSPDLFLQFKPEFPFWGVLAVNEGGMASHGGIIGLVAAATLFAMKTGIQNLYLYDIMCIVGPIGVFFGRIANFINGELVGRVAGPDVKWAVKFPQDFYQWPTNEPQRLSELADAMATVPGYTREQWLDWSAMFRTDFVARQEIQKGITALVDSIQRGNEMARSAVAPLLEGRHPSQLYAALGEGLFIFLVLFFMWRSPRKPGVIASTFIVLYACVRIVTEMFRMPDAHIGFQWLGLTRGQWLSVGMLLVGLVMVILWSRRETLPVPGWSQGQSLKIHRR